MLADWRHGETRDLHTEMMRLTMRIVARALLDVDVTDEAGDMGDVLNVLLADFSQRFGRAFPLPKWLPTSWNRRVKGARLRLDQILHDIIKQRRATGADQRQQLLIEEEETLDGDDLPGTRKQLAQRNRPALRREHMHSLLPQLVLGRPYRGGLDVTVDDLSVGCPDLKNKFRHGGTLLAF